MKAVHCHFQYSSRHGTRDVKRNIYAFNVQSHKVFGCANSQKLTIKLAVGHGFQPGGKFSNI